MLFEISGAKQTILERLVDQDWTPTDLASEIGKSRTTIYNHLDDLNERGVLTKTTIPAKTRPKTQYSIGDGFVDYLVVMPGIFRQGTLTLTETKEIFFRIWTLPQAEFHPYLEDLWLQLRDVSGLVAIAVYGSVARGQADAESDIDILIVADDEQSKQSISDDYGSLRIGGPNGHKLCIAEVYSQTEFRNSVAHGSDFLHNISTDIHVIYDPEEIFRRIETVIR